jgi:hypothetical protein
MALHPFRDLSPASLLSGVIAALARLLTPSDRVVPPERGQRVQWLGDLDGCLRWGDTAATLVGQGHGLPSHGDQFVAQQVNQGSVVEVLEPKPPDLGELAKDLALRHYSLLRPRQAVFRVRQMLSNGCSTDQLDSRNVQLCKQNTQNRTLGPKGCCMGCFGVRVLSRQDRLNRRGGRGWIAASWFS